MRPGPKDVEYFVSRQQSCMVLPLWRQGRDTLDIARTLSIPEFEVAKHLRLKLEERRAEQGLK